MELHETEERQDLRKAVAEIAKDFGHEYYLEKSLAGGKSTELWQAVGKQGFLGVNVFEGVRWFNKERFEEALLYAALAASRTWKKTTPSVETIALSLVMISCPGISITCSIMFTLRPTR